MVQWGDHDRRADAGPPRAGGDGGGEGQGLGQVAVVEEVVLAQPDGVAAEGVGLLAHLQGEPVEPGRLAGPVRRVAQVEVDADVHMTPCGPDTY